MDKCAQPRAVASDSAKVDLPTRDDPPMRRIFGLGVVAALFSTFGYFPLT